MALINNENQSIRREILNLLNIDSDSSVNDGILKTELGLLGLPVDSQRLRENLYWLQAQGLVRLETLISSIHIATLTDKGQDVVENRLIVTGIARARLN